MAHPKMYNESDPTIKKLREICLGLGGVIEKEAWGECTFRAAGGSMFAMTDNNHHNSGHLAVWVKAQAMVQEILINSDAKKFFKPPYVGHKGWVGVRLDGKTDWHEVAAIVNDGYRMSLPAGKRPTAATRPKGRRNASAKTKAGRHAG
jgi:predicted DNA-binding protein (MmcQ/YjbR family)